MFLLIPKVFSFAILTLLARAISSADRSFILYKEKIIALFMNERRNLPMHKEGLGRADGVQLACYATGANLSLLELLDKTL